MVANTVSPILECSVKEKAIETEGISVEFTTSICPVIRSI